MQEVTIKISKAVPVISVKGVKGKSCKELTKDLERNLGNVTSDKPTLEMHQSEVTQNATLH